MSDWMAIAQWQECQKLARPGIVFELRNAEGLTMLSPCVVQVPAKPFDWKSPPLVFRAVAAPKPQHSTPMPEPRGR
ncbi:MAG TPA: hypothetical protein VFL49_00270 [Pseudolabrys sp.]|nr:hypothetical protein [Pseudolabrys sp.]